VARLCPQALWLSAGSCQYWGPTAEAIQRYLSAGLSAPRSFVDLREAPGWDRDRRVILTSVSTHHLDGRETAEFKTGEGLIVRVGYQLDQEIQAYCQINFLNLLGERVMTLRSTHHGPPLPLSGEGVIQCVILDLRLVSGEYILMLEIGREFPRREWLDCVPEATRIRVDLGNYLGGFELAQGQGVIAQQSQWSILS